MMNHLEIEVKFYLTNIDIIRNHILQIAGQSVDGKIFETNIRFEDKNKTLKKKKCLLRLRKDKRTTLTFKSPPTVSNPNFKILKELEVEVNDFSTMCLIIESLGFHQEQKYEKWRETFILNDTMICLDILPFGNFIEIEGSEENIKKLSSELGLEWKEKILFNYLELFELIKKKMNLLFSDVTFDNFKNIYSKDLSSIFIDMLSH
ncbi:MAG: class IV adenylate cyclase [Desulfobacterales bacterium]|nr:class IV adenylate cyclase [Desulfobacterales bacterium]